MRTAEQPTPAELAAHLFDDQKAKSDGGKPQLTLVPIEQLWTAIARVREYAVNGKYKDPDNWKTVSIDRYHNALLRHTAAITQDLFSTDAESGLPHLWHIATNIAFILALKAAEETTDEHTTLRG